MASQYSDLENPEVTGLGLLRQHAPAIVVGAIALLGLSVVTCMLLVSRPQSRSALTAPTVVVVQVQPVTPPPPLPEIIEQPKVTMEIPAPNAEMPPVKVAQPRPVPAAPAVGTSIQANGQRNGFDLSGTPGGIGLIGGSGAGGVGGQRGGNGSWADYDSLLQAQITQALEKNQYTSHATFQVTARIWIDGSGTVTRAIIGTTGDGALDAVLQNQVFTGACYPAAPPAGMPMPIIIRITGERPL